MAMKGDAVMARGKCWLSTYILLLYRVGVGDFFSRIALR